MISYIINRVVRHSRIRFFAAFVLLVMTPVTAMAGKITTADSTEALREVASASSSPLSMSSIEAILKTGTPVYETTTTTFSNGPTQTASISIVPDSSAGTVTITKQIALADGGTESVNDVATVSGIKMTSVITTTVPDGSIQTKNETLITNGAMTKIHASVAMSGGGTQTITGETVSHGTESVTNETITNPAGQVYHDRIVVSHDGALTQHETNTTIAPGGGVSRVSSVMSTALDPSAVGTGSDLAALAIPVAGNNSSAPSIEAQELAPTPTANGVVAEALPTPLPEPGTLWILCVVFAGAGLYRRQKGMSVHELRQC